MDVPEVDYGLPRELLHRSIAAAAVKAARRARPCGAMINANLTPSQAWPGCYTAELVLYAPPWSETLWYGGPGGNC